MSESQDTQVISQRWSISECIVFGYRENNDASWKCRKTMRRLAAWYADYGKVSTKDKELSS